MTLRIALISEHASPLATLGGVDCGGQNVYVAQVGKWLASFGYEVDVLTRRDDPGLPSVLYHKGVRVRHIDAGPQAFVPKEDLLPHMNEFCDNVLKLCEREGRYDLVHANFWMSGLVAARLKQVHGTPFVITFHALGRIRRRYQPQDDRFPDVRFGIEDQLLELANAVVAECPQDVVDLTTDYRADPEKLHTIPCGFDPTEMGSIGRRAARRAIGIPPEGHVVLQLGRLVPRKGIDNVIDGFARFLAQSGSTDSRLLIVGGESDEPDPKITPEIGRLAKVAEAAGIGEQVFFVGRRSRATLKYYYCAADVFVTTPWYEPFGITPVEAMACGTPVIGSRVGGIQSTVVDGETGFLIPPRDPESLAQYLSVLYRQPLLRARMGREALARAYTLYSWETVSAAIGTLYESILGVSAHPRKPLAVAPAPAFAGNSFIAQHPTRSSSPASNVKTGLQ